MTLSALMTVYNEEEFINYAIGSCLPHIDHLVIVEGAYQETIKLGKSPRSTDRTIEIIRKYVGHPKVTYIEANEQTDKDQRNVGLEVAKQLNPDGWLVLIDGDEVYDSNTLGMIKSIAGTMDRQGKLAAYFKSLTFVNDLNHFAEQSFPRLFKITPKCSFVNDNFMHWPEKSLGWVGPHIIKVPYVRYCHYSFAKSSRERVQLKKDWWESRFGDNYMGTGKKFEYDWYFDENGKIYSPNHLIYEFTGQHPDIMKTHPLWEKKSG